MRVGRISKTFAIALAAALALAGCTSTPPEPDNTPSPTVAATPVPGGKVTAVESAPFSSFNPGSTGADTDTNKRISVATHSGFNALDNTLKLVKNEQFGKYQKVSDNPLTIKYTINNGVQWSDGEPVTAADLMLEWAAKSGYFNSVTGTHYFNSAAGSSVLAQTSLPVVGDNGTSLTLKYTTPVAEWETALGSTVSVPAHIVAVRAGLKDADELNALFAKVPKGDKADPVATAATATAATAVPADPELLKVAAFWNTGFNTKVMPDPTLAVSNGPYLVRSIDADKSLVLTRNADFVWGTKPLLDSITLKYAATPAEQAAALLQGSVDIAAPAASLDLYEKLVAGKSAGVNVQSGQSLALDAAILNFKGIFAQATFRTAFLKTVPRQQITDALVKPLGGKSGPANTFLFASSQAPYKDAANNNGSKNFGGADIAAAKALLGGATPTVRVLYNRDDALSRAEFALIAASATLAGFTVTDSATDTAGWGHAVQTGDFDVLLSTNTIDPIGVQGIKSQFVSGQGGNVNNFANPEVDQLVKQLLAEVDPAKQITLKTQIEKQLWEAGYGIPLFQRVGIAATGSHVEGVSFSPAPESVWWDAWNWKRVK